MKTRMSGILFVILLLVGIGYAQVLSGRLIGTVEDATGAVIPGARVTAVSLTMGVTYSATSDSTGAFVILNLPEGLYRVTVEATGFRKFVAENVQVFVGQPARVVARLEVGTVEEVVEVAGGQAAVETEMVELKASVDRRQIMNLPLPTRNPLDLVRVMPGVVTPTSSGIADSFVHGLRGNATNLTQDGVNIADNFVKTSAFFSIAANTVDSTGEFAVSVGGIGVDAGFGAAQVSMRTQRGQNDFHGSLFWYQRTNAFNANVWFNNAAGLKPDGTMVSPKPFQLQNRIGFNAGGPIYIPGLYDGRNKTWIFGMYEAFREPLARSRIRTVMTATARTGQFTWTPPGSTTPSTIDLLTIGNPSFTTINADVMNFYNSLVPEPNTFTGCTNDVVNIGCFQFNLKGTNEQDRYVVRLDHQLTSSHALEFVFTQADFSSIPDLLNGIEPLFPNSPGGGQVSTRNVITGALHSTFGARMHNEFRIGKQHAPVDFALFNNYAATGGFQLTLSSSGTQAPLTDPTLTSGNLPQGRKTSVLQVIDNFAWVKGRHTLRFGGEFRRVYATSYFFNTVPMRVFLGSNTVNDNGIVAADFPGGISSGDLTRAQVIYNNIVGLLGSSSQGFNHTSPTSGFVPGVPRRVDPLQNNFALYFQDNWRWHPRLNVTYGVRWEYQGVFRLRNGLMLQPIDRLAGLFGPAGPGNYFTPNSVTAASDPTQDVMLDFVGGATGNVIYGSDSNNFAPFLGFAWDPQGNGKTSIRAGAALHYTQDGFTLFQLLGTGNAGLFTVGTNSTPTGVFSLAGNPPPPTPVATFPVSQKANFTVSNAQSLWVFNPDLLTPYVMEWHLTIQRDLGKQWTLEARYVGNHAVKLYRATDINEINLLNTPFTFGGNSVANILTEFINAQNNLAICTANRTACTGSPTGTLRFDNRGLAGQVPLPIFEALFTGLGLSSGWTNSTFVTSLLENRVGSMFDTLRRSPTYRTNRENNFPWNFFVPNPFANSAIWVTNESWSTYHGFEVEVRRRFSTGLFLQGNYTFGKALTDQRFLTSQSEFQTYRTLRDFRQDKNRAPFDVRHSVAVNFLYPLPFGRGQRFGSNIGSALDKVVGGWSVTGLTRFSSGAPNTISSGRVTTGAFIGQPAVLRNMTADELKKFIGVFRIGNGVMWLNPSSGLVNVNAVTGATTAVICTTGQTTPCFAHPGPGQEGNLPFFGFDMPSFFNQDFSILKKINVPSVSESFNVDIRFEFFNVFNHPNFGTPVLDIASSSFGKLNAIVDTVRGGGVTSRIVQWVLRVNWNRPQRWEGWRVGLRGNPPFVLGDSCGWARKGAPFLFGHRRGTGSRGDRRHAEPAGGTD